MHKTLLQKNAAYTAEVLRLLDEIQAYNNDALNKRPESGGWSALQVMEHLVLSETLSLQYIRKKIGFGGAFEKRGISSAWRRFLLWGYLSTPIKFKAPVMVAEDNLPQHSSLADVRLRWESLRSQWTQFLEKLPSELLDKAIYKHPVAGRLGWPETIAFFNIHFNRHRKQIRRTLA